MPLCRCGTELPPRRRACDSCKAETKAKARSRRRSLAAEPVRSDPLAGLRARGTVLWEALGQQLDTAAGQLALEICRTADRLEELDSIIAGKGVLDLMRFRLSPDWWDEDREQHVHVTVGFQSVLGEARQQQLAFKTLLAELGMKSAPPKSSGQPVAVNPLDELERRRKGQGK